MFAGFSENIGKGPLRRAARQRRDANSIFSIKYGVSLRSIRFVKFGKNKWEKIAFLTPVFFCVPDEVGQPDRMTIYLSGDVK